MQYKIWGKEETEDGILLLLSGRSPIKVSKELYFSKALYQLETLLERDIAGLEQAQTLLNARKVAIGYLYSGRKSFHSLIAYLEEKGFPADVAKETARKLRAEKCLNDVEYACHYIRRRMRESPVSASMLLELLKNRGISEEDVEKALRKVGYDEEKAAREILSKKSMGDRHKGYRALISRGFDPELARNIVFEKGLDS